MKLRMTIFAVVFAAGGIARGSDTLLASPLEILQALTPKVSTPQACTDAAITPDQKTKIQDAAYQAMREKVQLDADLKLAFMNYGHTVMDATSDIAAAQAASLQVTDNIGKMAVAHMTLGTHILYEIVTPEQRAKTFECMVALHKMHRK
jgi:Spy/CpxP family protein refolding chaperone